MLVYDCNECRPERKVKRLFPNEERLFATAQTAREQDSRNRQVADDGWVPEWPHSTFDDWNASYERLAPKVKGRTLTDPFMGTPIVKCDPNCQRGLCRNGRIAIAEYARRLGITSEAHCTGCIDCVMAEGKEQAS